MKTLIGLPGHVGLKGRECLLLIIRAKNPNPRKSVYCPRPPCIPWRAECWRCSRSSPSPARPSPKVRAALFSFPPLSPSLCYSLCYSLFDLSREEIKQFRCVLPPPSRLCDDLLLPPAPLPFSSFPLMLLYFILFFFIYFIYFIILFILLLFLLFISNCVC